MPQPLPILPELKQFGGWSSCYNCWISELQLRYHAKIFWALILVLVQCQHKLTPYFHSRLRVQKSTEMAAEHIHTYKLVCMLPQLYRYLVRSGNQQKLKKKLEKVGIHWPSHQLIGGSCLTLQVNLMVTSMTHNNSWTIPMLSYS